jgi:hypothetical protein
MTWCLVKHRDNPTKAEGKGPLGRPRGGWDDNIVVNLREVGWEGLCWYHVAEDRNQWQAVVNTVMKLRVP